MKRLQLFALLAACHPAPVTSSSATKSAAMGANYIVADTGLAAVPLDFSRLNFFWSDAEWAAELARRPLVHGARAGDRFVVDALWHRSRDGALGPGYLLSVTANGYSALPLAGGPAITLTSIDDPLARALVATAPVIAMGDLSSATLAPLFVRVAASVSAIQNVVVILQENHSFDSYFGDRCQGSPGVSCAAGWDCCESIWGEHAPWTTVATGAVASELTDTSNGCYDPDHGATTELARMDFSGGEFKMDKYPSGATSPCAAGNETSVVRYASEQSSLLDTYFQLAESGALGDRYFQPIAGASSSNDMFLARAGYVFQDNYGKPNDTEGGFCAGYDNGKTVDAANTNIGDDNYLREYGDLTIGDLLSAGGVTWATYMEGYAAAQSVGYGICPTAPSGDSLAYSYPKFWDAGDNPFNFYPRFRDNPTYARDFSVLASDLSAQTLPRFSLVRSLGNHSEHPEWSAADFPSLISDGEAFVDQLVQRILGDPYYGSRTLVLVTWDEGGGFYDHVPPPLTLADGTPLGDANLENPPAVTSDGTPRPQTSAEPECYRCVSAPADGGQLYYGTRVPLLALGAFAAAGTIPHTTLEHSSIVKFLEWNFLGGKSGQLGTRDAHVNNLGSMLTIDSGVPSGVSD